MHWSAESEWQSFLKEIVGQGLLARFGRVFELASCLGMEGSEEERYLYSTKEA